MDKLKMQTPNKVSENVERIAALFPNCVTESIGADGKMARVVDFDLLRQELSGFAVEGADERYHLNWTGKKSSILLANSPITSTLRPCREESVNFDTTKNLYIEGNNLDVLKLLQETYLHKVKMIFIDPPYNTGRNLIYKNDFSVDEDTYLEAAGMVDEDGGRLVSNPRTCGRFHSSWLSMIYPLLMLGKNLLSEDGVFVLTIDENEFATVSLLLKELFIEGAYEHGHVSVVHNPRGQQGDNFSYVNEYWIFIYPSNNKKYLADFPKDEVDSRTLRDSGTESDRTDARNCFYPFIVKNNKIVDIGEVPNDSFHPESANVQLDNGRIAIYPMTDDGDEKKWRYARQSIDTIRDKLEVKSGRNSLQIIFNKDMGTMRSIWNNARYDASEYGTKLVEKLLGSSGFTYPKSLHGVRDAVYAATSNDREAIVLDFFSGSATTAHAVMQLNAEDGGNRRYIMAQIPVDLDENLKIASDKKERDAIQGAIDFCDKNGKVRKLTEIGKERIRRAGKKIKEQGKIITIDVDKNKLMSRQTSLDESGNLTFDDKYALKVTPAIDDKVLTNLDIGFRVLKTDTSNMKPVFYNPEAVSQDLMSQFEDNIKDDRSPEDLLFQVMLDMGVDLSSPITVETLGGKKVFTVGGDNLICCFDKDITKETVTAIAKLKPLYAVFRDSSFGRDDIMVSFDQIFETYSPTTTRRVI